MMNSVRTCGWAVVIGFLAVSMGGCSGEDTSERGITSRCVRLWNMSFSDVSKGAEYVLVEPILEDGYSSCGVTVPLSGTDCVIYWGSLDAQFDKMTSCELPAEPQLRVRELAVDEFGDIILE